LAQTAKSPKALFLDRDGIINEEVNYACRPDQITFLPDIFDLCTKAEQQGYLIFVVTNQSGVARGYYTEKDVQALHRWMGEEFLKRGICISKFYYCPFYRDADIEKYRQDSELRKPRPGMILKAQEEFSLDLSRSLMVGDRESDRIRHPDLKSVIVNPNLESADFCALKDIFSLL